MTRRNYVTVNLCIYVKNCWSCGAASACYNPEWELHEDQNSVGASEHSGVESVQECLDYCGSRSNCVAVDVDLTQQPPTCWPHFSTDDLLDRNVYSQPGTNQYRLTERCVNDTAGITHQHLIYQRRPYHRFLISAALVTMCLGKVQIKKQLQEISNGK